MNKITANKTKFYKLAKEYCSEMPSMGNTRFTKFSGKRSFSLCFETADADYQLYLSTVAGRATLGIEKIIYDGDGNKSSTWTAHPLTISKLREYGLLEEEKAMSNQLSAAKATAEQRNNIQNHHSEKEKER